MALYQIRHKQTGLFSTGGTGVSSDGKSWGWSKKGKVWNGLGPLKGHLTQYVRDEHWRQSYNNNIPEDWEVVELIVDYKTLQTARSFYPETKYQP